MLTVFEIYSSFQGESTHAGRPCVFVRLAACVLRCSWCDTPYAFTGGQKMAVEDVLARVDALGVPLVELTGASAVPKDRPIDASIPSTYVPARNTIFLSLALAWAETLGANDIVIGVNALDYSGYPDCRPEFIAAFERLAQLATREGVEGGGRLRVHTPLIALSKADIIRCGLELGLDYGLTHSCYDPTPFGRPCGSCDSCVLRSRGFAEAGLPDPLVMG